MNLKIKILTGYCILLSLLAFTIYSFRREQVKRNELHREESELKQIHRMTEEVYINLLDLASQAEIVISWEEEDFQKYREKREVTCSALQGLKRNMMTMEQQRGVDSLCCLLQEKEQLLHVIVNTFSELEEVSSWIQQKIPIIESTMWNQLKLEPASSSTEEDRQPKRNFFSNLFRKKDNKSAYMKQKEEREQKLRENNSGKKASSMLRSLNREISQRQGERQKRLLVQMDSLYSSSIRLNHKMNSLAADFEKESNERLATQYKTYIMEREENYCIITGLSIFTSLIAILLYVIVHRDLNRINRYQRQLEASNHENTELLQSRKRMMLTIAHDLRSPLATIRGTAELLPDEQERAMQEEYAGNIRHASDYMLSLVDTLMNFYLLDTGQARENVSIFRLESLFREIADNHAPLVKKKGLRMLTRFSGMDAVVCSDRGHLQQIVNNLLSNALKFTVKGYIRLEAAYHEGELRIKVQDTGTGKFEHFCTLHDFSQGQVEEFMRIIMKIKESKSSFENLINKYTKAKAELYTIEKNIREAEKKAESDYVQNLRARKENIDRQIDSIGEEIGKKQSEIETLKDQVIAHKKQKEILSKKINVSDQNRAVDNEATRLIHTIQKFLIRFKEEKKKALAKKLEAKLQSYLHKTNLVKKVIVDINGNGDDVDICLFGYDDKKIDNSILSMGERQMFASALLSALVDETEIEFPVFIDSPMQKFDPQHTKNVLTKFYPNVSKQVILFPLLKKELTEEEYQYIQPIVNKSYLINNEKDGSHFVEVKPENLFEEYNNSGYAN